jgi:UDP-N-acetylmuramate dehydrogenase
MSFFPFLKSLNLDGALYEDYSLKQLTWLKCGGKADIFFKPYSQHSLQTFLTNLPKELKYLVIGNGSNLLIRDGGINDITIKLGGLFKNIQNHKDYIEIGAAALNTTVSWFCMQNGIKNFAFLNCIPGSIGGGIAMNCGSYKQEISDILLECTLLDSKGTIHVLKRDEIKFEYRKSNLPSEIIILSAKFKKELGDPQAIKEELIEYKRARALTQPIYEKTAGCTFVNTKEKSAWQLIKETGCDKLTFGDAQWSEKHANFLINKDQATSFDLEKLIRITQERIFQKTGIQLECEIKIIGHL